MRRFDVCAGLAWPAPSCEDDAARAVEGSGGEHKGKVSTLLFGRAEQNSSSSSSRGLAKPQVRPGVIVLKTRIYIYILCRCICVAVVVARSQTLAEHEFHTLADAELESICAAFEALGEEQDIEVIDSGCLQFAFIRSFTHFLVDRAGLRLEPIDGRPDCEAGALWHVCVEQANAQQAALAVLASVGAIAVRSASGEESWRQRIVGEKESVHNACALCRRMGLKARGAGIYR